MKSIVNEFAKTQPAIKDREAFAVIYRKHHPQGPDLTEDNVRQAFDAYKKASRKITRTNTHK